MGYEKITIQNLYTAADQNSDLRMPVGGTTGSTDGKNNFNGDKLWNNMVYTLNGLGVGGAGTGGSYTVTVEGKISGMSNPAPIARASVGPLSVTNVVLDNLCQSPCSPRPDTIFIDQTASGGTINTTISAMGKTYRGVLPSGPSYGGRVVEGKLVTASTLTASRTDAITAVGTTASFRGLDRLRLWDAAMFWVETQEIETGDTWECDLIAEVNGVSTTVARTGTGGTIDTSNTVYAMQNLFYGSCPRPTQIIWTGVSASGLTASVFGIAKANRGQRVRK